MTHDVELGAPRVRPLVSQERRPPRWLSAFGAAAAGFTALCCAGVSAAVSLSTAIGATFLTRDATLRPLLGATLAVTVVGSALTFWRRRRPGPLAVTVVSAVWIYSVIYLVGGHHGQMGDHMSDHPAGHASPAGLSGGRLAGVWVGLAFLVCAQFTDLARVRRRQQKAAARP